VERRTKPTDTTPFGFHTSWFEPPHANGVPHDPPDFSVCAPQFAPGELMPPLICGQKSSKTPILAKRSHVSLIKEETPLGPFLRPFFRKRNFSPQIMLNPLLKEGGEIFQLSESLGYQFPGYPPGGPSNPEAQFPFL